MGVRGWAKRFTDTFRRVTIKEEVFIVVIRGMIEILVHGNIPGNELRMYKILIAKMIVDVNAEEWGQFGRAHCHGNSHCCLFFEWLITKSGRKSNFEAKVKSQ